MCKKNSNSIAAAIAGAALLFAIPTVLADTLSVPQNSAGSKIITPKPGAYMSDVLSQLGEPSVKSDPVGLPPISRWEYNGFRVYFEHDRVIHSVMR